MLVSGRVSGQTNALSDNAIESVRKIAPVTNQKGQLIDKKALEPKWNKKAIQPRV